MQGRQSLRAYAFPGRSLGTRYHEVPSLALWAGTGLGAAAHCRYQLQATKSEKADNFLLTAPLRSDRFWEYVDGPARVTT